MCSKLIEPGDKLISVDEQMCTPANVIDLLYGSDVPGSSVQIRCTCSL